VRRCSSRRSLHARCRAPFSIIAEDSAEASLETAAKMRHDESAVQKRKFGTVSRRQTGLFFFATVLPRPREPRPLSGYQRESGRSPTTREVCKASSTKVIFDPPAILRLPPPPPFFHSILRSVAAPIDRSFRGAATRLPSRTRAHVKTPAASSRVGPTDQLRRLRGVDGHGIMGMDFSEPPALESPLVSSRSIA
jgi:hypothetical protein